MGRSTPVGAMGKASGCRPARQVGTAAASARGVERTPACGAPDRPRGRPRRAHGRRLCAALRRTRVGAQRAGRGDGPSRLRRHRIAAIDGVRAGARGTAVGPTQLDGALGAGVRRDRPDRCPPDGRPNRGTAPGGPWACRHCFGSCGTRRVAATSATTTRGSTTATGGARCGRWSASFALTATAVALRFLEDGQGALPVWGARPLRLVP